jgi:hypothetical protein
MDFEQRLLTISKRSFKDLVNHVDNKLRKEKGMETIIAIGLIVLIINGFLTL